MDITISYLRHSKRVAPRLPRESLISNDLTIVIHGTLEYIVDGIKYQINDGEAIFIPGGTVRERHKSDLECDYISFNFKGAAPNLPIKMSGILHSEVVMLIGASDRIGARGDLSSDEKQAPLLTTLLLLLLDYVREEKRGDITVKIIDYLRDNMSSKISLSDIGKLTFFSPEYCDTVFRRDMGKSIIEYLIDLRIERARRLIIEDVLPLSEISTLVGFTDYNYFSRTFKKRTGYSPTAYRKAVK